MVSPSPWICGPVPDSTAHVRLFCFPYGGGGANVFSSWRSLLGPKGVDVCCVQLPGRETRFREMPIKSMDELVFQTCQGIEPYLCLPFSFFGHSMGALVCFEVARELARRRRTLPQWLRDRTFTVLERWASLINLQHRHVARGSQTDK
jgi:medium-chain acyl-[acyl-carrier-protein] hydrolase